MHSTLSIFNILFCYSFKMRSRNIDLCGYSKSDPPPLQLIFVWYSILLCVRRYVLNSTELVFYQTCRGAFNVVLD